MMNRIWSELYHQHTITNMSFVYCDNIWREMYHFCLPQSQYVCDKRKTIDTKVIRRFVLDYIMIFEVSTHTSKSVYQETEGVVAYIQFQI